MYRWLVSMLLLSWVGFSAAAPQGLATGGVVSFFDKHGLLMDPDGDEENVELGTTTRHGLLMDPDG